MLDNKLKLLRLMKNDITQQALADGAGCSRQTIHSIESGKFVPSVELAIKISKILGVHVEEIFQLKPEAEIEHD